MLDWTHGFIQPPVHGGHEKLQLGDMTTVKNYRSLISQVKQGISEAIVTEQVPPGYHESIKSYFDSLEPANGK